MGYESLPKSVQHELLNEARARLITNYDSKLSKGNLKAAAKREKWIRRVERCMRDLELYLNWTPCKPVRLSYDAVQERNEDRRFFSNLENGIPN